MSYEQAETNERKGVNNKRAVNKRQKMVTETVRSLHNVTLTPCGQSF